MGGENIVNFFKDFGDGLVHRLVNCDFEIGPEIGKKFLIIRLASADVIQFFFKGGCVVVADVFAEKVGQESRDKPPFIFGDQAVLVFAHVVAVLDRRDDRRIG